MRKNIFSLLSLMSFFIQGFSQDLLYEVRGDYSSPVTKEILSSAKTMSDFRHGYPSTWITQYISTEISSMIDGKFTTAVGLNDTLNEAQRNIFQKAQVNEDIIVSIKYKYSNSATNHLDTQTMHFIVTVVPEIEAEYPGGYSELSKYLHNNAITQASKESKDLISALIKFTVTETGEITNAQVFKSSENSQVDKLLLKAIKQMPNWKPAENNNGVKIRQEFQFNVGNIGC